MTNTDKKILIVEDEAGVRKVLTTALSNICAQIDEASDGQEAWELVQEKPYHLIMTDMFMPRMNGIDLILKIQQTCPETKTVLLSGGGRGLQATEGLNHVAYHDQSAEVDQYLKKPARMTDLINTVKRLLA
jgi:YesN/AraC family two-component response regulator